MSALKRFRVPTEKLRWQCSPQSLGFKTTNEITANAEIIGQERALKAVKLGLEISSPGYNIYIAGLTGTGKSTTIKSLLERMDKAKDIPGDICYVHNFENQDVPHALFLSAGTGCNFQSDMEDFIDYLGSKLPKLLESETFKNRKKKLLDQFNQKSIDLIAEFEEQVRKEGLAVVQLQVGQVTQPDLMPVLNKEVVPWQQLEKMVKEGKYAEADFKNLKKKHTRLNKDLEKTLKANRQIEKEAQIAIQELNNTFVQPVISGLVFDLKEKYKDKAINAYLDQVEEHMIDNLEIFTQQQNSAPANPLTAFMPGPVPFNEMVEYKVNVFVDNKNLKSRPVIIETAPNYKNLFGTIERVVDRNGITYTDFTKIKAGSLIKANGGFLVLNMTDLLNEAGVWNALKRTLKNRKLDIQAFDPFYLLSQTALKPETIDINLKVVIIGDSYLYRLLYMYDDDFRKIFKVKADFDSVMGRSTKTVRKYSGFIKKIIDDEKLQNFDSSAVAEIIEYGVRLAGKQLKLSTRFSDVADIIREANYWAVTNNKKIITAREVNLAMDEKRKRSQLGESKIQEMIDTGTILIDTKGSVRGQVNGLAVYDSGDYSFGKPSRITATVGVGSAGIINIEREANLSGKTHNKGVLIIGGYFRTKYAYDKVLSFSASLAFEQSYSGVDGDSASSTEIYALLSELSGLALRQEIAVTGSVNQKGQIQPIGGVNQKVEGFYDVCKARKLTGNQGVLIPHQNVNDLMLRPDVVDACAKGKFHIYAIKSIDEGIEILTGISAGRKRKKGGYTKDSVHYKVEQRLVELAGLLSNKNDDNDLKKNKKSEENSKLART